MENDGKVYQTFQLNTIVLNSASNTMLHYSDSLSDYDARRHNVHIGHRRRRIFRLKRK
jgi:hypothetical protein